MVHQTNIDIKQVQSKENCKPKTEWTTTVLGLVGTVIIGLVISIPLTAIGLMFNTIEEQLKTTATTMTWLIALLIAVAQFAAPVNTIIGEKYSYMTSLIIAGIVCSLGLIGSYFVTNVEVLFLSFSIAVGIGLGLSTNASFILLKVYVKEQHYILAVGILLSSHPTGRFIFSPVIELLLESYGFQGAFLIIGGLTLNIFVGVGFCKMAQKHHEAENVYPCNKSEKVKLNSQTPKPDVIITAKPAISSQEKSTGIKNSASALIKWFNEEPLYLKTQFKSSIFYILAVSEFLSFLAAAYVPFYMAPYVENEKGLLGMHAATLSSIRAFAEIVSRILTPVLKLRFFKLQLLNMYCVYLFFHSLSILVFTFASTFEMLLVVVIVNGFFYGGCISLSIGTIQESVPPDLFSSTIGVTQFLKGFFSIGTGPIMGILVESSGSFSSSFYFLAAMQLLLCAIWVIMSIRNCKHSPLINNS